MRQENMVASRVLACLLSIVAISNAHASPDEVQTRWHISGITVGISCEVLLERLSPNLRTRLIHINDSGGHRTATSPCAPPEVDPSGYDQLQLVTAHGAGKREAYRFVTDSSKRVVVVEYWIMWDRAELRPGIQSLSDQLQSRYGTPYARMIPPDTMFAYSAHMDARWSSSRTSHAAPRDFNPWVFMEVCQKRMPTPAAVVGCMQKANEIPQALDALVDSTDGVRLEAMIIPDRKGDPSTAYGMRLTLADYRYEKQWRERRKNQQTSLNTAQERDARSAEDAKLEGVQDFV